MMKFKRLTRGHRVNLTILVGWLLLMPLFQNCGSFNPSQISTYASQGLDGNGSGLPHPVIDAQPDIALNGKALYTVNCSMCHGSLESSTVAGRSASQITSAINSVTLMSNQVLLKALTSAQVSAIATALGGNTSPTTTPSPTATPTPNTQPGATPTPQPTATPTPTPSPISQTPVGVCTPGAVRGLSKEGVRRLTREEIKASLNSVFPGISDVLKLQLDNYPDTDIVEEVSKFDPLHSEAQVFQWADTVDALYDHVTQRGLLNSYGAQCLEQNPTPVSCSEPFFTNLGKKVYRRPLSNAEVASLSNILNRTSGNKTYAAIHLLFRSPAFLFHLETGVSEESGRVRLSDHDVANRISFGILGSPADAQLVAAADAGQLRSLAQVEAHTKRLLESEGAKTKLKRFFSEWLQYSHIQAPQNEYMVFFQELQGNGNMDKAYAKEIEDYLLYTIWTKKGTFRDLMTQPIAFPRFHGLHYGKGGKPYSPLAAIYNTDPFSGFTPEGQAVAQPFPAPNHPGLVMRAGFFSSTRWTTQPITRGVFVQRRILCEPLPSPDFSVVNARLNEVGELDPIQVPNHQIVTNQTNGPACTACHGMINPMGFALEGYDILGKVRTEEKVMDITKFYSEKKGVVATHPLPKPVTGVRVGEKTATIFTPAELAEQFATSTRAKLCLSTFVLRHFDRRKENSGDSCSLAETTNLLQEDRPLLDLFVKSIANDDIFWRRK